MDTLRIILIIIGIAVLIAVYWLSKPRKPRQATERDARTESFSRDHAHNNPQARDDRERDTSSEANGSEAENLSLELERLSDFISREREDESTARADKPPIPSDPKKTAERSPTPPERIVVLYVRTRDTDRISGDDLQSGTQKVGLEYGDMEIYHRLDEAGSREAIFSLANMIPPGTLDKAQSKSFTTPGVTLFLQLPGPVSGLDAFDGMLAAAQRLAQLWGAEVLDDGHSQLSRQRIQQLREEMRDFDRRSTITISAGE